MKIFQKLSPLTKEQKVARGEEAARLLNDPALQRAVNRLEEVYYQAFKTARTDEERLNAQQYGAVLDAIQNQLAAEVSEGELSVTDLEREKKNAARRKRNRTA